jgi:hypothetical protein
MQPVRPCRHRDIRPIVHDHTRRRRSHPFHKAADTRGQIPRFEIALAKLNQIDPGFDGFIELCVECGEGFAFSAR